VKQLKKNGKILIRFNLIRLLHINAGCFFFAFYGTYAGGGGKNRSKIKIIYSFFLHCLVKNSDKSQNSKKLHIGIQRPEQISQEERVFIIFSKKF